MDIHQFIKIQLDEKEVELLKLKQENSPKFKELHFIQGYLQAITDIQNFLRKKS